MISDKRERNRIGYTMSERLFESDKKPPLRLFVIRNGMPKKVICALFRGKGKNDCNKTRKMLKCAYVILSSLPQRLRG